MSVIPDGSDELVAEDCILLDELAGDSMSSSSSEESSYSANDNDDDFILFELACLDDEFESKKSDGSLKNIHPNIRKIWKYSNSRELQINMGIWK